MLALWKKSYDKPRQHIQKQRRHFANKGLYSQSYGFPVVVYRCESWTIKKAEREELMILNCGLLRVPWTARRSNQSILKEINPEYWLEGLILKLKLQYFGHLMQKANSLEKTLMLGKVKGRRWSGWQRVRWWMASLTQWTWVCANSGRWWRTGKPGRLQSMGSQRIRHNWVTADSNFSFPKVMQKRKVKEKLA